MPDTHKPVPTAVVHFTEAGGHLRHHQQVLVGQILQAVMTMDRLGRMRDTFDTMAEQLVKQGHGGVFTTDSAKLFEKDEAEARRALSQFHSKMEHLLTQGFAQQNSTLDMLKRGAQQVQDQGEKRAE